MSFDSFESGLEDLSNDVCFILKLSRYWYKFTHKVTLITQLENFDI